MGPPYLGLRTSTLSFVSEDILSDFLSTHPTITELRLTRENLITDKVFRAIVDHLPSLSSLSLLSCYDGGPYSGSYLRSDGGSLPEKGLSLLFQKCDHLRKLTFEFMAEDKAVSLKSFEKILKYSNLEMLCIRLPCVNNPKLPPGDEEGISDDKLFKRDEFEFEILNVLKDFTKLKFLSLGGFLETQQNSQQSEIKMSKKMAEIIQTFQFLEELDLLDCTGMQKELIQDIIKNCLSLTVVHNPGTEHLKNLIFCLRNYPTAIMTSIKRQKSDPSVVTERDNFTYRHSFERRESLLA